MLKRLTLALSTLSVISLAMFTVAMPVLQALQPPDGPPTGFVSIGELPESEKLPAAPFLVAAYVVVWLIAMFYIWTIWKRVNKLEDEFRTLEKRSKGSAR